MNMMETNITRYGPKYEQNYCSYFGPKDVASRLMCGYTNIGMIEELSCVNCYHSAIWNVCREALSGAYGDVG